ncbi:MAG: hypothetical protein RL150_330 [Candidatus Parcubacteria bacterium]|jgi:UPF0176 protein
MSHTVLLYYKYVLIDNPEQFRDEQRALCEKLGLKGRIIVAHEGLNGTVEGTTENTAAYEAAMHADPRFADMVFKKSAGTGQAFPRLSVKVRKEIVTASLAEQDINPAEFTAPHLDPTELDTWYEADKDFVVVDMRNDYEFEVGHFEKSVMPGLRSFRELPERLNELEQYKDKTVVTVCTGGVRCEKASGYLLKQGFTDVYQLDGGMATYMDRHPGKHFRGKLYVFDNRIVVGDGSERDDVVGKCKNCETACEEYANCGNEDCHLHFICCDACIRDDGKAFCSAQCEATGRIVPGTKARREAQGVV